MKMQQVMMRCAQAGYPVSRRAIYDAGEKYGFIKKVEGKNGLEFNQEGFEAWLKKAIEQAPKGFYTINECAKQLNISVTTCWSLCKSGEIEVKHIGSGRGIMYANIEQLKELICKRKFGTEEKYGN